MDLHQAEMLILDHMHQHGLTQQGWRFEWDNHKSRFGSARGGAYKVITLSKPLTYHRDYMSVRNTILHEIAHALVGPSMGHGPTWRAKALSIGCDGKRCSADTDALSKVSKYKVVCMHESAHVLGYVQTRRFRTDGRACKEHKMGIVLRPNT